ncbi:MAG: STAS domain-containing protein [Candidatus Eisenbacteria bacterium]
MRIRSDKNGGVVVVELAGALEADTVEDFNGFFQRGEGRGESRIVLELSGLEYMDSSGLGAFVRLMKEARKREGDVLLVGPTNEVKKVLELTRLNRVFGCAGSVAEALERFAERAEGRGEAHCSP